MKNRLEKKEFKQVICNTPLVAIEFLIRNSKDEYLLGFRKAPPAKGFWFNLGGRIFKDETLAEAKRRVFKNETGKDLKLSELHFVGVFEHFYNDNVFNDPTFGTHYVVLAHYIECEMEIALIPEAQHSEYRWWSEADILNSKLVHENTKAYFVGG